MAKKENAKAKPQSVLSLIRKAGFENKISEQKTKLWEVKEELATLTPEQFEFYVSQKHAGSCFIVIREGNESTLVPFITGQIDADNYDADGDNGLCKSFDEEVQLVLVEALRDDDELGIAEGDTDLRVILA